MPKIDLVFVDRGAACAHLIDQRQQRAAERHQLAATCAAQKRQRSLEERFGCGIGIRDSSIGRDHDDRVRQCIEHGIRGAGGKRRHGHRPVHATLPFALGECAEGIGEKAAHRDRFVGGKHAVPMMV